MMVLLLSPSSLLKFTKSHKLWIRLDQPKKLEEGSSSKETKVSLNDSTWGEGDAPGEEDAQHDIGGSNM